MKNFKLIAGFMALAVCSTVYAGAVYDKNAKETTPKYHPTKPVSYEDSYHIAGVSWGNDRAIASEAEREPSSVPVVEEPKDPKPWLHKATDDKEKY